MDLHGCFTPPLQVPVGYIVFYIMSNSSPGYLFIVCVDVLVFPLMIREAASNIFLIFPCTWRMAAFLKTI